MYAKVFTQIFDSSIAEDYQTRHVFEDFLKLADVDGVVDMTAEAIARRTNVPLDLVTKGITKLEAPDPFSRSKEEEGRRIVPIDSGRGWGWRIVNYEHYRNIRDEEARRSYYRNYMKEYREKKAKTSTKPQMLNSVNIGKAPLTKGEGEEEVNNPPTPQGALNGNGHRKPWNPTELQCWLNSLFRRRNDTRWTDKELRALRSVGEVSPEDRKLLDTYYHHKWPKDADYRRRSLITLLNNFPGDVDKARMFKPVTPKCF